MFRTHSHTESWPQLAPAGSVVLAPTTHPPVRRGMVFAIVAFALMMMSIDSTIVATALDTLQHDLHTSINWAGWTITAYSFGFLLMLPLSGKLSERFGHRRVFIGSVFAFTAASLCCGLVSNIYWLIVLRAIQAAGGAGFTPSATGIVVDHFGNGRDRAVSLFGSIFPVGAMIGPIFGGLFVTYLSWRDVFLVNVPIGVAVIALAWHFVPHDAHKKPDRAARTDLPGLALLGMGLFTGMLAASYLGEPDAHVWSAGFLLPALVAGFGFWAFSRHVHRSSHPFIAPLLIHGRGFGAVNLVNVVFGGITSGTIILVPLYAANRYGLDALDAGTLLVAQGMAAVLLSLIAALALRRSGYRVPLYVGVGIIAAGAVLLAIKPIAGIPPYWWLVTATSLIGIGAGIMNPASRNAGLQLAPERSSTLAALRSMGQQAGSISMISIATAILAGSSHPGVVQAWIYVVGALVLVVTLPLVARVPEHHGAW